MLRDDHLQRGHSLAATLPSLLLCSQSTQLPSYHCNVEQHGEYEVGDLGVRSGGEDGEGMDGRLSKLEYILLNIIIVILEVEEPPRIRFVTFALHTSSSLCSFKAAF